MNTQTLGEIMYDRYHELWPTTQATWGYLPVEVQRIYESCAQAVATEVLKRLPESKLVDVAQRVEDSIRQIAILANLNSETRKMLVHCADKLHDAISPVPEQQPQLGGPEGVHPPQGESPPAVTDVPAVQLLPTQVGNEQCVARVLPLSPAPRAEWKPKAMQILGELCDRCGGYHHGKPCYLQPAPWKLPEPPEGMQWHRTDWTKEMLPDGWRPILKGEPYLPSGGDQRLYGGSWESGGIDLREADWHNTNLRTRRPLPISPVPKPEKRLCIHCGLPIEGAMIGAGDGTGQKFAHPECYYRKDTERLHKERDAALAQASEAEKALSAMTIDRDAAIQARKQHFLELQNTEAELAVIKERVKDESEQCVEYDEQLKAIRASVPVWVRSKERLPTASDGDNFKCVWVMNLDTRSPVPYSVGWKGAVDWDCWMTPIPLPPLPVETEEGEDGFQQWRAGYGDGIHSLSKEDLAQVAFTAGQQSTKKDPS